MKNQLFLALAAMLTACQDSPGPSLSECRLEPYPKPISAEAGFGAAGEHGNGDFGRWEIGPYGLPEYEYTLREESDPRADWPNTEKKVRKDHWHLVGNLRLNALAFNEGYVELFTQTQGNESLTRYDPESSNFGGGFSIIAEQGRGTWNSAYTYRPRESRTRRYFGMGYVRYQTCTGSLEVSHTIWAPEGDAAYLVDDVQIRNLEKKSRTLSHYEVWDVNRHYFAQQEVRSGILNPKLPATMDAARTALNKKFKTWGVVAESSARVVLRLSGAKEDASVPSDENLTPPDVFLSRADGGADRFITDGAAFWGAKTVPSPANLRAGNLLPTSGEGQPGVLVAERKIRLAPERSVSLRYAVGAVPQDAPIPDLTELVGGTSEHAATFAASAKRTADKLVRVEADPSAFEGTGMDAASLRREMAWHSYYLRNLGGYQDYFEHFVINQGSAYWYKHGLDGAVRDFVFTAAAMAYIDPPLARELLLYASRMRFESSKALAYTVGNNGQISDAVIHDQPSDLDLFWWWGLAEYIAATGDESILTAEEPFWPKHESQPRPLHEHVRIGARYLIDEIGVGPHGILRMASGDWDDGITFFAPSRDVAKAVGESVANSAMAAFIAPWAAAMLDRYGDAATAAELRALAATQRELTGQQWVGGWYRRAWFGENLPFGDDAIFLFSNVLAMIADVPSAGRGADLLKNIGMYLEDKSTTSLFQFWYFNPPAQEIEGVTDAGASNPVISGLSVWGFANYSPERAWKALLRNTMAVKADVYPGIWYGIWSGSDSHYTNIHKQAGQTWASVATPQKDFPIMNSNAHNGPLLGLLRVYGLEPVIRDAAGVPVQALAVRPKIQGGQPSTLDLPLLRLDLADGSYTMEYRPVVTTTAHFVFGPPPGKSKITTLLVAGNAKPSQGAEAFVSVAVVKGKPVRFEVR